MSDSITISKQLKLEDLVLTILYDDAKSMRIQTGRISRWYNLDDVKIECASSDYTLTLGVLYIDISNEEADQICDFVGHDIVELIDIAE